MACDATTIAALAAKDQLAKLSDRSLLAILANLYGGAKTASAAQATAMANGYAGLSEFELWQCFLAAICSGTCDASTLAALSTANGYEKMSYRDLFEGMVAVGCTASCSASALTASAEAAGYDRLSERGLLEALVANACSSGCSAKTLLALAFANGYQKFDGNFKELLKAILATICKNGGGGGGGGTVPALTNFSFLISSGGTAVPGWDVPPAAVTATELWTSQ